MQNYILEKFQFKLKTDKNPIKNHSSLEFKYYKIEPSTVVQRKKKNFKVKGLPEPKEYLLDFDADTELFKKREKLKKEKEEVLLTKPETPAPEIKIGFTPQQNSSTSNKKPLIQVH